MNEYKPWEEHNQTDGDYFRERYTEARAEVLVLIEELT